eukprot:TRINITY_DN2733_c1_g1_i5.p1 TRINITY_DN2733_c1_g1~~TRINITY_DN2733_c1_g1_i5.p1  ORF type:complete len:426 (+),score=111.63 TRINITY_DN2733_c1_g1_i5:79-1278(+)
MGMEPGRVAEILASAGDASRLPKEHVEQLREFAISAVPDGPCLRVDCTTEQEAKDLCGVAKRLRLKGRIDFHKPQAPEEAPESAQPDVDKPPEEERFTCMIWHKQSQVPDMVVREPPQRPQRADNDRPRPDGMEHRPRPMQRRELNPGDWLCTAGSCNFVNQAKYQNTHCHRCGTERDAYAPTGGPMPANLQGATGGGAGGGALSASDLEAQLLERTRQQGRAQGGHQQYQQQPWQQQQQQQQQQQGQQQYAQVVGPGEWKETIDPKSGKPYYYHTKTQEVTWERPASLGGVPQRAALAVQQQAAPQQQGYSSMGAATGAHYPTVQQGLWGQQASAAAAGGWLQAASTASAMQQQQQQQQQQHQQHMSMTGWTGQQQQQPWQQQMQQPWQQQAGLQKTW